MIRKRTTKAADHAATANDNQKMKKQNATSSIAEPTRKKKTTDDDRDLIASRLNTPLQLNGKDGDDTYIESNCLKE